MNFQLTDKMEKLDTLVSLDKEYYSYKDIEEILHLDNKPLVLPFPIGHRFDKQYDYLFSSNPYHVLSS